MIHYESYRFCTLIIGICTDNLSGFLTDVWGYQVMVKRGKTAPGQDRNGVLFLVKCFMTDPAADQKLHYVGRLERHPQFPDVSR